ncbi:MAG: uracil-DNA glycosylase family protein [Bacteroidales bacterium]|nr:uracil-DNA glycosylase family protein [Bacteroidales bacterium]
MIESHPLTPFLPKNCKVLFLGSFPPQKKRWSINFFYPNFINDHWRIEGQIFFNDKNYFVDNQNKTFYLDKIIDFLNQKGIGIFDTATKVNRLKDNASDKFLEIVEKTDINKLLLQIPECKTLVTTGEKATETICEYFSIQKLPKVGENIQINSDLKLYRLPSSSRAYPLAFDKKVEEYKKMFQFVGVK